MYPPSSLRKRWLVPMRRWQLVETFIDLLPEGQPFSSRDLADAFPGEDGTQLLASHLTAQRGQRFRGSYVIKRHGRTRNAMYTAGHRRADEKALSQTLFEDIRVKIKRAYEPDLRRMTLLNPSLAKTVEIRLDAVVEGAVRVLAAALQAERED